MGKNFKQRGFTAVETVLILVIIGLLGFTGWYVWHSKQTADTSLTSAQNTNYAAPQKKASTKASNTTTATSTKYLVIKEWGVKITLTDSIKDSYYLAGNIDKPVFSQANLSLNSLKNTQCRANAWPVSIYFRYASTDRDPVSGELYTKENGTAHYIGRYYYAYDKGSGVKESSGCMSTKANQQKADAADKAFDKALDTIQAAQ